MILSFVVSLEVPKEFDAVEASEIVIINYVMRALNNFPKEKDQQQTFDRNTSPRVAMCRVLPLTFDRVENLFPMGKTIPPSVSLDKLDKLQKVLNVMEKTGAI